MRILSLTALAGTMLLGSLAPSFADGEGAFHSSMYRFLNEDQARQQDYRAERNLDAGKQSIESFAKLRAQNLGTGAHTR